MERNYDTIGGPITSDRLIRFKELKKIVPLGRTTIWQMMCDGRFPRSHRIGKNATAWLETDIKKWIREQTENSNAATRSLRRKQMKHL